MRLPDRFFPSSYPLRVFSVLLLALALLLFPGCKKKKPRLPLCDVDTTSCSGTLADGTVVALSMEPRPVRSMADLRFEVRLTKDGNPVDGSAVMINFQMPAMYMGENKVKMTAAGEGRYVGRGSIVKCPSGDRLWDAGVSVANSSQSESVVHFRFEVDKFTPR